MAEFRPHVPKVREAGVNVVVVGSGAPNFARGFRDKFELGDLPIWCDQPLASYAAAGMNRGGGISALNPMVLVKGIKSAIKYPQKHIYGDVKQLGGALVVKKDGTIAYRYVSRYAGDHPKNEALVEAALKAKS